MVELGPHERFAQIMAHEERLNRDETRSVIFAHATRWVIAIAAISVLLATDAGGIASAADGINGTWWHWALVSASFLAAIWTGWSQLRRERELIEMERTFLRLEMKALRQSLGE